MEFVNLTQFQFAYLPGRNNFPGHSLTLIVKGTFKLRPAEVAVPVEDQPFPTGDELYPDDEEGTGAPRYENDFAPFKPRTDLLLVGNCYAPGQTPVPFSRANFRVGKHQKSVNVIGHRTWKGRLGGWTDPEPFAVMPIRYENSFGGEGFAGNPAGKGYQSKNGADAPKRDMLPNIEDVGRIIRSKKDQPDPVGFGPLNRMWHERFAKVGTYKGDWKEKRFPAFPSDFDWAFFNAAQPDLRVDGYLRGDEEISMENLHPEIPLYLSKLPGIRIRCFVEERQTPDAAEAPFYETKMNLDTLWVDMESEVLTLVWRGVTEVSSEEFEEIESLMVCAEQVEETPVAVQNHRDILHQTLAAVEREWSGEDEDTVEDAVHDNDETDLQAGQDAPEEDETEADAEMIRVQAQMAAMQAPEPSLPPPAETDEREKTREQILEEAGADGDFDEETETPKPIESREDVEELIAEKRVLSGLDLRNIDLSNLIANDVDFSGANLNGVCLAGSSLAGSLFVEADLEGADLSECNLSAANLTLANIQAARLMRSVLCDADFTDSRMMRVDLSSAEAKDAIFESAQLEQGHLEGIQAQGADFSEANLNGAILDSAMLDDTSFSGASVQGASFKGSSLRNSDWAGAEAQKVILDQAEMAGFRATEGCDFSEASFREAKGMESNWQGANLSGADFSYAEMEGADFTKACLQRTCLEAADMKHAKFHKADLEGAKLVTMNLFQGSLETANLKDADLSGSNMYGVEFQDAIFNNTVGKGTNLKMTKQDKG